MDFVEMCDFIPTVIGLNCWRLETSDNGLRVVSKWHKFHGLWISLFLLQIFTLFRHKVTFLVLIHTRDKCDVLFMRHASWKKNKKKTLLYLVRARQQAGMVLWSLDGGTPVERTPPPLVCLIHVVSSLSLCQGTPWPADRRRLRDRTIGRSNKQCTSGTTGRKVGVMAC